MKYQWIATGSIAASICSLAIVGNHVYKYYYGKSFPQFACRHPRSEIVEQTESIRPGDSWQDVLSKIQAQPTKKTTEKRNNWESVFWTWSEGKGDNKIEYELIVGLTDGNVTSVSISSDIISNPAKGVKRFFAINKIALAIWETSFLSSWTSYEVEMYSISEPKIHECIWERNLEGMQSIFFPREIRRSR